MMNYEIFKEVVKEKFMDYMPEKFKGMELVAEPVEKVNVTLDGIILREEGRNISPTIYINDMYKKYQDCGDLEETLMAACDFMERAYEQVPVVDVDSIMKDANETRYTSWKETMYCNKLRQSKRKITCIYSYSRNN